MTQHYHRAAITQAYEAFNRRDIDSVLLLMHPDVRWPNGWEGGYMHGREAVRDYWTRLWQESAPIVKALTFEEKEDGQIAVMVHQIVKDLSGRPLLDGMVLHTYTFDAEGKIKGMEISRA